MWGLALVAFVVVTIVVAGRMIQLRLRRLRDDHSLRPNLWNRFYDVDLGDTATNN